MFKKATALMLALCFVGLTATACGRSDSGKADETPAQEIVTNLPRLDMTEWQYDANDDVYYQLGIGYCETPADESYEKLAIFVPGAYMDAEQNDAGAYTCKLNEEAGIGGYTADTAPIIMPINTPGYASAPATAEYRSATMFTSQGFVYVEAGCRGLQEGAPTGVADLKAAIRYLRYSDDEIAGDAEKIFVLGMSGGGAQAAILGASGDSDLYDPYLGAIGAVRGVSDAVAGVMSWCPICDLDTADAGYEWMMGAARGERSTDEKAISDRLATAFADYINGTGFTDEDGNALTLTESKDGVYQSGSYYNYIKRVIEGSLNNYLSDIYFSGKTFYGQYQTPQAYIDSLNEGGKWVDYDNSTKTVSISGITDFVRHCKPPMNMIVAFDHPLGQNTLFGIGDGDPAHYDRLLADIFADLNSEYAGDYAADLKKTDAVGNTVEQRVEMYAPLYYLMESREGYGTSTVAKYWRIRSGIKQINTSLSTEVDLALALKNHDDVKSVDFETVWERDHTEAERTGDSTANFIDWVNSCMGS